jgi:Ser/Thr protein kinase RdoA (MazF antagonist)
MQYGAGPFLDELCDSLALQSRPRLLRSNTNLVYDCGDSILRLTPESFRPAEEVHGELHWLHFVGTHTDNFVRVLGDRPTETTQFSFAEESFSVTRFARIEGNLIRQQEWKPPHFERLGRLAGSMHRIGQEYTPPEDVDLCEWDHIPEACLARELPEDCRELPRLNERVFAYMTGMPRNAGSYGPIHYDIHAGNYLMAPDGRIVLFDFENSCRGHYINDIAVALYYARLHPFSTDDDDFSRSFLASFWRGYEQEYVVPTGEMESIPWLLLNRGLIVYGYLLKIWPGDRNAEQQRHLQRVEQGIRSVRTQLGI